VKKKRFAMRPEQLKPLAPGRGACYASDMITVKGRKVGYMHREAPDFDADSGWRFFSGSESQAYADNPDNFGIYDVNTIANCDTEIIPLLDAPVGSEFERLSAGGPLAVARPLPGPDD
jgi:hypothetical protein